MSVLPAKLSDLVFRVPTFDEVGYPHLIGMLGYIGPRLEKLKKSVESQWVKRGDPLATYSYFFYDTLQSPKFLRAFRNDPVRRIDITLPSPISGLWISSRHELSRDASDRGVMYYSKEQCLPVVLASSEDSNLDVDIIASTFTKLADIVGSRLDYLQVYAQNAGRNDDVLGPGGPDDTMRFGEWFRQRDRGVKWRDSRRKALSYSWSPADKPALRAIRDVDDPSYIPELVQELCQHDKVLRDLLADVADRR